MPVKFQAERRGETLVPLNKSSREALAKVPEFKRVQVQLTKPRSQPQHNLFFAAIQVCYDNWPYGYNEFQPTSPEHLRAWAECKVGWSVHLDFPLVDGDVQKTAELLEHLCNRLKGRDKFPFIRVGKESVRVYTSKTVNHDEVDQSDFGDVAHSVFVLLESIVGPPIETMLKNKDAAA